MMIVQALHNPFLGAGILMIVVSLYLQLTLQQRMDRLETRFKNEQLSSRQLDRRIFFARWLPVFCTVIGVALLIWGFNVALEVAEAAEIQKSSAL